MCIFLLWDLFSLTLPYLANWMHWIKCTRWHFTESNRTFGYLQISLVLQTLEDILSFECKFIKTIYIDKICIPPPLNFFEWIYDQYLHCNLYCIELCSWFPFLSTLLYMVEIWSEWSGCPSLIRWRRSTRKMQFPFQSLLNSLNPYISPRRGGVSKVYDIFLNIQTGPISV